MTTVCLASCQQTRWEPNEYRGSQLSNGAKGLFVSY
jgi:hypothetical protein